MEKAITGRITLNLIAGILITVVTVSVTILWMAQRQNDQANEATRTMVIGGVEAMERRIQGIANDYAWWEDAYDAYVRQDADWMWSNIGSSVEDTQIADLMAIVSPVGEIEYGWTLDGGGDSAAAKEIVTPEVIAGIRNLTADMKVENLAARAAFIPAGNEVMMIGVSRIAPVSEADSVDPAVLPVFVAGFLLSEERLTDLGKSFLIDDLRLDSAEPGDALGLSGWPQVTGLSGDAIAHFVWTPPTPGSAVLKNAFLPIFAALSLFCVAALATAYRARKMAIALADSEKEAVIAARTDGLTGLMNRTGMNELVTSDAYKEFAEEGNLSIIYIDINGFKAVNDSIGHHGGDELVQALASRLKSMLPADAVFARIGGDEFAIAIVGPAARDTAAGAASAVVHCLDQPFTISGFEFHVTVAVGYALSARGVDPDEVIRRADLAMYQAKNGAEREAVVYHSTMETGALEKKQVETALRRAVDEGELKVFYQPIVRASDLTVVALEALVRWNSKEFGNVSPAIFIPVAEDTGLIHEIGRIVVRQACQDMARWDNLKVAINISPVQLRDPNFTDDLMAIVERYGISPHQIELELTEGILVSNPTIAKRKLAILKDLGFVLSLDDFGTGFSSIGYLRQFPFDILKVDRSFIRDIGLNTTANALIQALVSLGDAMSLSVIAEGIENEDQLKLVRLVQCECVQGFLISRPIPATEIDEMLASLGDERRIRLRSEPASVDAAVGSARAHA
jgi:diguanylate cyclase (GGDEF)-like protein